MHSSTPLQRQWQIVITLMSRRQGMTIKELAREVDVTDRTIIRDLNTLRKVGFPLDYFSAASPPACTLAWI